MPNQFAFPVWDYIQDEMDARGWTLKDLADRMGSEIEEATLAIGMSSKTLRGLRLGSYTADALGKAFGTSGKLWLNLDNAYHAATYGDGPAPDDGGPTHA